MAAQDREQKEEDCSPGKHSTDCSLPGSQQEPAALWESQEKKIGETLQEAAPHTASAADTWGPPGRAGSTFNLQTVFNMTPNTKFLNFS